MPISENDSSETEHLNCIAMNIIVSALDSNELLKVSECSSAKEMCIRVLRASLDEVGEVHTHPPLPVGLLHQDHICQPHEVLNLPYVVGAQQLLRLFFDDLSPHLVELSSSLADRSDLGVHCEAIP